MKLGILTRSQLVTRLRSLRQDLETGLDYPDVPVPPALLLRDLCQIFQLNAVQTGQVLGVAGLHHLTHVEQTRYKLRPDRLATVHKPRRFQGVADQRKEQHP